MTDVIDINEKAKELEAETIKEYFEVLNNVLNGINIINTNDILRAEVINSLNNVVKVWRGYGSILRDSEILNILYDIIRELQGVKAISKRQYYMSLIDIGFSHEDAMKLLLVPTSINLSSPL